MLLTLSIISSEMCVCVFESEGEREYYLARVKLSMNDWMTHACRSRADERSRFRMVGGIWSAVTADTATCRLCDTGYFKPWDGPGMCEVCSERILPWNNSHWVSPTLPGKGCSWECDAGFTHVDPPRYSWNINALWWEHGLSLGASLQGWASGLGISSHHLPNTCVPCTGVPETNPCSKGEYWLLECTSARDSGCSPCSRAPPSTLYTDGFEFGAVPVFNPDKYQQHWLLQDACPRQCEIGYYDSRLETDGFRADMSRFDFSPVCAACPDSSQATFRGGCPKMATPVPADPYSPGRREPCGLGAAASDNERRRGAFSGILEVQVFDGKCDPLEEYMRRTWTTPWFYEASFSTPGLSGSCCTPDAPFICYCVPVAP